MEGETKFSKIGNLAGASDANGSMDLKALDLQQLFLAMTEEVSRHWWAAAAVVPHGEPGKFTHTTNWVARSMPLP